MSLPVEATHQEPLVSVIMPVYQGEADVLRAVSSVLNQTYANLELIVVDDGSTDRTRTLLEAVGDDRLRVLSQANQGVARARNHALTVAQGEYIAFLDADDRWFPHKLAVDMATLRRNGNPVGMVYSGYYAVDEADRLVNLSAPNMDAGDVFYAVVHKEGLLLPSTTTMHRRVVEAVGGFPTDSYHEDRVFFLKAARDFPAYPTGQRTVIYRQTLSGRCRRILKDFHLAVQSELSIVDALKNHLEPAAIQTLTRVQTRNLFYRFLMYNFVPSARTLAQQIRPTMLLKDKKGVLALLSVTLGVNALYAVRVTVQWVMRTLLSPWWQWKQTALSRPLREGGVC